MSCVLGTPANGGVLLTMSYLTSPDLVPLLLVVVFLFLIFPPLFFTRENIYFVAGVRIPAKFGPSFGGDVFALRAARTKAPSGSPPLWKRRAKRGIGLPAESARGLLQRKLHVGPEGFVTSGEVKFADLGWGGVSRIWHGHWPFFNQCTKRFVILECSCDSGILGCSI